MREHARAQHSTRVDTASPSACPANYPDPVPQPCPQHLPHPTRTLNNVLQQHARAQYSNCLPHYNRTQHARTKHSTRVDTASPSAYTFQLPRSTATTVSATSLSSTSHSEQRQHARVEYSTRVDTGSYSPSDRHPSTARACPTHPTSPILPVDQVSQS